MEFKHTPVLLEQCIENLNIDPDGIYVDGTIGGGGHSYHICEKLSPKGTLIGIDRDTDALEAAKKRLEEFNCNKIFVQSNYSDIKSVLAETGIDKINGALLDLGVSSFQLDNAERGFSYMAPMENPKLAVLVVVDSPKGVQYGSVTAAPIARTFLKNALTYLEISPKYTKAEAKALSSSVVYVPSVTGKSVSDAIGILGSYGLKYKISPSTNSSTDFKVVDQYPKAGKQVSRGDTVYIYRK